MPPWCVFSSVAPCCFWNGVQLYTVVLYSNVYFFKVYYKPMWSTDLDFEIQALSKNLIFIMTWWPGCYLYSYTIILINFFQIFSGQDSLWTHACTCEQSLSLVHYWSKSVYRCCCNWSKHVTCFRYGSWQSVTEIWSPSLPEIFYHKLIAVSSWSVPL